ncbi:hypothetical protein MNBD_GAMMA01-98 [hydrothermal vent metagenome]|uniref:Transposase IS200-like domain-containing protein n=1 Tax=hydrothermal vent metagenome TaxID=652676 RepID=A0A3B0V2L4_9ZZZZ
MPRKPRIEYENAVYHVMNRGRGRQRIFHHENCYQTFINLLKEVHERFGCKIHGYCLMGNHYHLLLETPNANLSRIMRHINGVYTQYYNRLHNTDGTLFRGRFKSILVDQDAYLLQLSCYIHRNPIDSNLLLVDKLYKYKWSSFRAYINKDTAPDWLHRDFIYNVLGCDSKYKTYENYVTTGVDDDIRKFYGSKNLPAVIGEPEFKEWIFDKLTNIKESEQKSKIISTNVTIKLVITIVAKFYRITVMEVTSIKKGPQRENEARKMAMYLCQELTGSFLKDIAPFFNLNNVGSVSHATYQIRKQKRENQKFAGKIEKIIRRIVRKAT